MERLDEYMSRSIEMFERAKRVTPGGVHSPVRAFKNVATYPRFIEKAEGCYLYDEDQKKYLDFCMSWGPLILGHQDPEIKEAVLSALDRGWSYGATERYSLELAEWLVDHVPHVEMVRFVSSGTEAVMSALRLARAATKKDKIVKFDGCYHGHVDSMLVASGSGLAEQAKPDSDGVSLSTAAETLVCPLGNLSALCEILDAHSVAAVIIEPLPANFGLLVQDQSFLEGVAYECKKRGVLLIFDEVISGFRVALGGMAERTGIKPDLVTYGKIIGGGFPVGAFGGRKEIMELLAPCGQVYQAGTLSGNPVAMVAGLSTLRKIKKNNPYGDLATKVQRLQTEAPTNTQSGAQIKTFAYGSLFWMVMSRSTIPDVITTPSDIPKDMKQLYGDFYPHLLERGVYLAPSGFEVGFMSMAHTDAHIDTLILSLREVAERF
jgi:glutamate-1-semialdehyde 2,1-aminomutase